MRLRVYGSITTRDGSNYTFDRDYEVHTNQEIEDIIEKYRKRSQRARKRGVRIDYKVGIER